MPLPDFHRSRNWKSSNNITVSSSSQTAVNIVKQRTTVKVNNQAVINARLDIKKKASRPELNNSNNKTYNVRGRIQSACENSKILGSKRSKEMGNINARDNLHLNGKVCQRHARTRSSNKYANSKDNADVLCSPNNSQNAKKETKIVRFSSSSVALNATRYHSNNNLKLRTNIPQIQDRRREMPKRKQDSN